MIRMFKVNYFLLIYCFIVFCPKLYPSNPTLDSLFQLMGLGFATFSPKAQAELLHETGHEFHFSEQHAKAEEYLLRSLELSKDET